MGRQLVGISHHLPAVEGAAVVRLHLPRIVAVVDIRVLHFRDAETMLKTGVEAADYLSGEIRPHDEQTSVHFLVHAIEVHSDRAELGRPDGAPLVIRHGHLRGGRLSDHRIDYRYPRERLAVTHFPAVAVRCLVRAADAVGGERAVAIAERECEATRRVGRRLCSALVGAGAQNVNTHLDATPCRHYPAANCRVPQRVNLGHRLIERDLRVLDGDCHLVAGDLITAGGRATRGRSERKRAAFADRQAC